MKVPTHLVFGKDLLPRQPAVFLLWLHIVEGDKELSQPAFMRALILFMRAPPFSSVQFSSSVTSNFLWPHGLQHVRLPYPSPTPIACSNSCPSSQWCHPTILSCHPCLLLPSIFPSIRVFSSESVLHITWPKYWGFSFNISPSNEYSGLISFRMDWLNLLVVQGTLKSLLQHHSSKASILRCSAFLYSLTLTSIHDYWKNHSFEGQLYTTVVFCADENVK